MGRMSIRRRMMQDAMRQWRHLGLGLVAAKERLALTVENVTRRIFTSALRRSDSSALLRRPSHVTASPDLVRVVFGLIAPHRIEDARKATRQGHRGYVTPTAEGNPVGPRSGGIDDEIERRTLELAEGVE